MSFLFTTIIMIVTICSGSGKTSMLMALLGAFACFFLIFFFRSTVDGRIIDRRDALHSINR